jgi:hypothetical protein
VPLCGRRRYAPGTLATISQQMDRCSISSDSLSGMAAGGGLALQCFPRNTPVRPPYGKCSPAVWRVVASGQDTTHARASESHRY